ncbi:dolichyl-P-Man:Man(5)GlcNAc(2)-PP-dolichol alpha-1,3-mannosyltransferase [Linnemannia schmuckeri]|uniref:Dol-P-Man:Man(5)GlcNAc(2)-PP-Dol alpha-1,3-mannosyltransferase n=1 Tax=Linnemannia schmuckeri TaxID=64567 RepID=A0A9P5S380_9FUNG|nr:dolichyl-P-Man:Man(5)GlcNAc(2)-PP-dolichol alpha-1,3-mannosyltransferase [Linnemannia schmuckeri]
MAINNRARQTGPTTGQQGSSSSPTAAPPPAATSAQASPLTPFRPIELVTQLLTNHAHIWKLAGLLFLFEILLNIIIIKKIPYTEIDWVAYMQEVSGYLKGETDYTKLRGDTGPLVYPAGFVYIYSTLYYATDFGENILRGQWIFMGLYLMTLVIVFSIYAKDKSIPPYVLIPVCLSRRLHSIYVLRLFNDPVAMFFLYAATLAFLNRRWTLSSTLFSLAVSIKMNILLFFPAFGFLLWQTQGIVGTLIQLTIMVLIQVLLSLPFTFHHPRSYLNKAFEFSRVFQYQWTVNWKFLEEEMFLSSGWAKCLLAGHFVVLFAFVFLRWSRAEGGIFAVIKKGFTVSASVLAIHAQYMQPSHVLTLLFTSNFIGIVFARSLHYQFYAWYSMTLPYLLYQTRIPVVFSMVLLGAIEWSWNVFPATVESSEVLVASHLIILVGLWIGKKAGTENLLKKRN